jgi:hypothetical protein
MRKLKRGGIEGSSQVAVNNNINSTNDSLQQANTLLTIPPLLLSNGEPGIGNCDYLMSTERMTARNCSNAETQVDADSTSKQEDDENKIKVVDLNNTKELKRNWSMSAISSQAKRRKQSNEYDNDEDNDEDENDDDDDEDEDEDNESDDDQEYDIDEEDDETDDDTPNERNNNKSQDTDQSDSHNMD